MDRHGIKSSTTAMIEKTWWMACHMQQLCQNHLVKVRTFSAGQLPPSNTMVAPYPQQSTHPADTSTEYTNMLPIEIIYS